MFLGTRDVGIDEQGCTSAVRGQGRALLVGDRCRRDKQPGEQRVRRKFVRSEGTEIY